LRQQERLRIDFREIFRVVRFSTFATISANSGLSPTSVTPMPKSRLGVRRGSRRRQLFFFLPKL
jgi:hypothetical protein